MTAKGAIADGLEVVANAIRGDKPEVKKQVAKSRKLVILSLDPISPSETRRRRGDR